MRACLLSPAGVVAFVLTQLERTAQGVFMILVERDVIGGLVEDAENGVSPSADELFEHVLGQIAEQRYDQERGAARFDQPGRTWILEVVIEDAPCVIIEQKRFGLEERGANGFKMVVGQPA